MPLLEILVIDDGSEDATSEIAASYGARVRYMYKENGGKPSAVNLGLSIARGDLIWLFDDDDVALPDATENRLAALESTPGAGFVYSAHFLGSSGPDGCILRGQYVHVPRYSKDEFFLEIMRNCFFSLSSALVKRELYENLGGLDPSLYSGEDYDFTIRLSRIAEPSYCSEPTFIVRQHNGARGAKSVRYSASERSVVFNNSSQAVGRKLRVAVSLGDYLPGSRRVLMRGPDYRQALLNRIQVMGNHGCIIEIFEDLRALLSVDGVHSQLSTAESRQLALAMQGGFAYDTCARDWHSVIQLSRGLRRFPGGRDAIRALARGLFVLAKSYPGTLLERANKAGRALWLVFESVR